MFLPWLHQHDTDGYTGLAAPVSVGFCVKTNTSSSHFYLAVHRSVLTSKVSTQRCILDELLSDLAVWQETNKKSHVYNTWEQSSPVQLGFPRPVKKIIPIHLKNFAHFSFIRIYKEITTAAKSFLVIWSESVFAKSKQSKHLPRHCTNRFPGEQSHQVKERIAGRGGGRSRPSRCISTCLFPWECFED